MSTTAEGKGNSPYPIVGRETQLLQFVSLLPFRVSIAGRPLDALKLANTARALGAAGAAGIGPHGWRLQGQRPAQDRPRAELVEHWHPGRVPIVCGNGESYIADNVNCWQMGNGFAGHAMAWPAGAPEAGHHGATSPMR